MRLSGGQGRRGCDRIRSYRIDGTVLFYDLSCIGIGKDDFKGIIATDNGGLFLFSHVAVHDFFNAGSIGFYELQTIENIGKMGISANGNP